MVHNLSFWKYAAINWTFGSPGYLKKTGWFQNQIVSSRHYLKHVYKLWATGQGKSVFSVKLGYSYP